MNAAAIGLLVVATIASISLSGCQFKDRTDSSIETLERCARAMSLEAEAYERLDRVRKVQSAEIADRLSSQAYLAAAQYRASACFSFPPDAFDSR